MHKKVLSILGTIFLSIGVLLGVIAIILYATIGHNHRRIARDSVRVTATIAQIDWGRGINVDGQMANVLINYEVDGVQVRMAPLRWTNSGMHVGQPVDILVSRQNPHVFVNTWGMYLIPVVVLSGLAVIFGGIGMGFLVYQRRKRRQFEWLLEYGTPVWANVLGIDENWSIQINGRPAMVLVAAYDNMRFVSGPLDNNDLMNIGEHIKILLDHEDANKYAFDFNNESRRMPDRPPAPLPEGSLWGFSETGNPGFDTDDTTGKATRFTSMTTSAKGRPNEWRT